MNECSSKRRLTARLALSLLALASTATASSWEQPQSLPIPPPPQIDRQHDFTLRHIFHRGTYRDPTLHKRLDINPETPLYVYDQGEAIQSTSHPRLSVRSQPLQIERLSDRSPSKIEQHLSVARLKGEPAVLGAEQWTVEEVPGPNVTDKDTVLNLAIMTADAYVPIPGQGDWEDVTGGFNRSQDFGWETDGLRGYIFATERNETIIVSLKGTSPAVFDGDGTTTKDKLNDNLFFSCCCAQGGQYFWRQVCDCYSSTYTCNQTCLVTALRNENRYYRAAIDLYTNITEIYPESDVWIVGHSLGGAVSSLLGLTFGLPVVTFEAPGEDLAAKRLGLPAPPSSDPYKPHRRQNTGAYHFGNTADPIFMGTCNGATATCTLGGYAMESQCHTGKQCIYDTVGDLSWRVGIGNHKIHVVIDDVIKKYDRVPECVTDTECVDCFNWKYFESNGSTSTSTSMSATTTKTRTRSSTCKTPGWWGCLDESTTSSHTTTAPPVMTTTYTTTSCVSPGWFGCKETVNVTLTTTTLASTVTAPVTSVPASLSATMSSSSSCQHRGFFGGCHDDMYPTSSATPPHSHSHSHAHVTRTTHSCETPGLFFGCRDRITASEPSSTMPHKTSNVLTDRPTSGAESHSHKHPTKKCKHPAFFGLICMDSAETQRETESDDWRASTTESQDSIPQWKTEL